jgi:hypothetical protein
MSSAADEDIRAPLHLSRRKAFPDPNLHLLHHYLDHPSADYDQDED